MKLKKINKKRAGTKFVVKIIWNQMLRDEIENKIQLQKLYKKITIKRMKIKFNIKIKWNQLTRKKIKENNKKTE